MKIIEVIDKEEKSKITDQILHQLPDWFGVEESVVTYIEEVKNYDFYVCLYHEKTVGFITLKYHNAYTAEIAVMGILAEYHRLGIGRKLVETCLKKLKEQHYHFLTVKTLDASRESESYRKTREFYKSLGFIPLEVFKTLWTEANPCLFLCREV